MENKVEIEKAPSRVVVGLISRDIEGKNEYLLMASKKDFGQFTGFYYPPGGHLEKGEDEADALKREIKEELGVECIPEKEIAQSPGDVINQITHWWKCNCVDYDFRYQEEEVADVRWFSEEDIRNSKMIWPATRSFFEGYVFSK